MKQELLNQFNKETGITKPVDTDLDYYQSQYINWLEQRIVNKNDLLPDVSTRTWEFSYDEDFADIEMTLDVPNDKDPYDALLEHVPDDIAPTLWYRAI